MKRTLIYKIKNLDTDYEYGLNTLKEQEKKLYSDFSEEIQSNNFEISHLTFKAESVYDYTDGSYPEFHIIMHRFETDKEEKEREDRARRIKEANEKRKLIEKKKLKDPEYEEFLKLKNKFK